MVTSGCAVVHESGGPQEIVHVVGEVDEINSAELEDVLEHVVLLAREVTVDLTHCLYIGSAGLRVLMRARQHARRRFTTIVETGSMPARTLEIAKVESVLGVRRTAATARLNVSPEETVRVVTLDGEWDLSRGSELRRHMDHAVSTPRVVLDMTDVTYIDEHCLGMLARARTRRVAKGYRPPHLVVVNENMRKVLGIGAFGALWNLYGTVDEALAELK